MKPAEDPPGTFSQRLAYPSGMFPEGSPNVGDGAWVKRVFEEFLILVGPCNRKSTEKPRTF